jgi:hypothetical protein
VVRRVSEIIPFSRTCPHIILRCSRSLVTVVSRPGVMFVSMGVSAIAFIDGMPLSSQRHVRM